MKKLLFFAPVLLTVMYIGSASGLLSQGGVWSLTGTNSVETGGTVETGGGWQLVQSIAGYLGSQAGSSANYSSGNDILYRTRALPGNLDNAHAYPVPFRGDQGQGGITFTALPGSADIRIYSIAGRLVKKIAKNDFSSDAVAWNVTNDNGEKVASGLYLFVIESGSFVKKGKLVVIR